MRLTTFAHDERLDLDVWVGQRSATYRFQHIDGVTGQIKADLTPIRDTVPTLLHNSSRTITRSIQNIAFGLDDTQNIDVIRDRVLIFMQLDGMEFPLGRYMFIDQTRQRFSSGLLSTAALVDETFITDQPISIGFTASETGGFIIPTIERLLADFPISFFIEPSPFRTTGSWQTGTSAARILEDLALDGDYFSPFFDNNGILQFVRAFDPADQPADLDFDNGNKVYAESIAETDDLINAPNRIVVISNGAEDFSVPVVGVFDIPSSAPHSILNRGFVVAQVNDLQIASVTQAQAVAANIGQRQQIFQRTELSTAPDPRHDGWQVIGWQGENWLQLGWSLELIEGGEMRHTLRRSYR